MPSECCVSFTFPFFLPLNTSVFGGREEGRRREMDGIFLFSFPSRARPNLKPARLVQDVKQKSLLVFSSQLTLGMCFLAETDP